MAAKKPINNKPTTKKPRKRTMTPKATRQLDKARPVYLTLTQQHSITVTILKGHDKDGKELWSTKTYTYGPGQVRVKPSIARVLMEQERNVHVQERQLHEPRARLIYRDPNNGRAGTYAVAPELFDEFLGNPGGLALTVR
jgi:hypothetical protein